MTMALFFPQLARSIFRTNCDSSGTAELICEVRLKHSRQIPLLAIFAFTLVLLAANLALAADTATVDTVARGILTRADRIRFPDA